MQPWTSQMDWPQALLSNVAAAYLEMEQLWPAVFYAGATHVFGEKLAGNKVHFRAAQSSEAVDCSKAALWPLAVLTEKQGTYQQILLPHWHRASSTLKTLTA